MLGMRKLNRFAGETNRSWMKLQWQVIQMASILLHNPGGASSPLPDQKAENSGLERSKVWGQSKPEQA
jgi:hypothetical protein